MASPSAARVLVVDDAPLNVKLLRTVLSAADYVVLEAGSGPEALQVMRSARPDAMLLDVNMPGMTGYEVCQAIRRDPEFKSLPVIMVTGRSLPEARVEGLEAGATEFLTKPFERRELLARLRSILKSKAGGESALLPHLPGAVVLADLSWNIFGLSAEAAVLLDLAHPTVGAFPFKELLDPRGLAAAQAGIEFEFEMSGRTLSGLQLAINEPRGAEVMRVISLRPKDGRAES